MTDPTLNVATVLNDLAAAFGGHPAVPDEVVGRALRGQFTNNPGLFAGAGVEEVLDIAAAMRAGARWDGTGVAPVRASIARGFSLDLATIG